MARKLTVILESGFDGRVYICSSKRGTYGVSILRRRREGEFKNAVVFVLFESGEVLTGENSALSSFSVLRPLGCYLKTGVGWHQWFR